MKNNGRMWERICALQNQEAYDAGIALVTRVPTHYHGGIPSRDPKLDYVGALSGGRMVAYDAKSGTGRLSREQRNYAAGLARMGAVVFVYHSDGYVRTIDANGQLGEKQIVERWWEILES